MRENARLLTGFPEREKEGKPKCINCRKSSTDVERRHKTNIKDKRSLEWEELKHIHRYINIMLYNFITKKVNIIERYTEKKNQLQRNF